ncbi:hypothetical protein HNY73_016442 [Argiope bruennichi]|uniref:DUF5641 domain-containing protein n=1 Tax=Argiope bruennichi TaxID=94029 RepID=A0A8T0ENQ0_ARGBR|nr:hypothetical protein HNY73_016442 [Argiope bruennichi]
MDKLSKLRKTRGLHRSSVTKYINKINSDLEEKIDSLTTKDLQEALNYLNISSTQLKDYDKLIQNLIKDDKEFETEIESAFEYNEKIIVCLSKLSAQLKCLQDESERQSITPNVSLLGATGNPNLDAINNTQESSAIVPVNEHNFKTIKLPKLTIEKYYGDPSTIQYHLKRWSLIQSLRSKFWKRWSQEYLNSLQSRAKWKLPELYIKPGQLVLLKDNSKSPMEWNLARIERTYPGTDGLVRVADIRTPKGIFRRSINRLCPLPFEEGVGQLSNGGRDVPS